MKEALLTVSFGTAVEQARQADICAVERTVAQALPHLHRAAAGNSYSICGVLLVLSQFFDCALHII